MKKAGCIFHNSRNSLEFISASQGFHEYNICCCTFLRYAVIITFLPGKIIGHPIFTDSIESYIIKVKIPDGVRDL